MSHFGTPLPDFHTDATLDCVCGLPLFPVAREGAAVRYECANRHQRLVPFPSDLRLRRLIEDWLDRRTGQLDEQHRRWEEDETPRDDM